MSFLSRMTLACVALLSLVATTNAVAQQCDAALFLTSSTGYDQPVDRDSGLPFLAVDGQVALTAAWQGCHAAEVFSLTLPNELQLVQAPDECAMRGSELVCRDLPASSGGRDEAVVQRLRYTVAPSGFGAPLEGGDIFIWEIRAGTRSEVSDLRGSGVTLDQGVIITNQPQVHISSPSPAPPYVVAPGATLSIPAFSTNTDLFTRALMHIPSFAYQSASGQPPPTFCAGGGSSVNCEPVIPGGNEQSWVFDWTAPAAPGTYGGSYTVTACGISSQTNCHSEYVDLC